MTDYISYKTDRWLYPLEALNAEPTVMQVRSGVAGAWLDVDITPRTLYASSNLPAASGLSLTDSAFAQLKAALETALGSGTITISAQDATSPQDYGFERLKITWSVGQFQLQTDGLGFIDGRDFGFEALNTPITSSTGGVLLMPYAYAGAWHSYNFLQGGATIKRRYKIADYGYSSARHWEAQAVSWGAQDVRIIQYKHLPAARVMPGRSNDPQRARLAHLKLGDPMCFERVFTSMLDPQRVFLIAYDLEPEDGLTIPDGQWESVQPWRPWLDYSAQITDMGLAGDYWQLELALRIKAGDYPL